MAEPGEVLADRYKIESVLGQGGMGAVYLATMEALGGKKVAIKEMELRGLNSKELEAAVEQFRSEAKILAHLEHPNLVAVTDFFVEADKHYLVMAYVSGETLQQRLRQRGRPFSWGQVQEWARPLAEVLTYLHTQDPPILFRDLKPSNVMVESSGRVKLIDFGIARMGTEGEKTSNFLRGTGTSGFSPIEQYGGGQSTDQRSDIYSLAATLYQLLTGNIPPDAVSRISQGAELIPPSVANSQLPKGLDPIFLKALALSKGDRQGTVDEFLRELDQVKDRIDEESATEDLRPPVPPKQPIFTVEMVPASEPLMTRLPWGAVGAAVAALLALMLGLTLAPKLRGEGEQLQAASVPAPASVGSGSSTPSALNRENSRDTSSSQEESAAPQASFSSASRKARPTKRAQTSPSGPTAQPAVEVSRPQTEKTASKSVETRPRESYPTAARRTPSNVRTETVEETTAPTSGVEPPVQQVPAPTSAQAPPSMPRPGEGGRPPVPEGMPSPVIGPDGRPWPPPQGGFPGGPQGGSQGPYSTRDSYRGRNQLGY